MDISSPIFFGLRLSYGLALKLKLKVREFSGKQGMCLIELIFISLVSNLLVLLDSSLCYN